MKRWRWFCMIVLGIAVAVSPAAEAKHKGTRQGVGPKGHQDSPRPGVSQDTPGNRGSFPFGFSKGKKEGWEGAATPPGWEQGKKKGWGEAKTPPGLKDKR